MSQIVKITSDMDEKELLALKKYAKRGENYFVLKVEGERYPQSRPMPIRDLPFLVGINGELRFQK